MKGWAITLIAVLLAVDLESSSRAVTWVALVPAFGFWFLDAYYLRQERLFREVHKAIVGDLREDTERVQLFDMNTDPYRKNVPGMLKTMLWRTLPVFYGPMVVVMLVVWRIQTVRC